MAINFSASFAACLAAGLKVPRQIMYCISQDTGAPYVLYKDTQEAVERGAVLNGSQWNGELYSSIQQQQQQQQQQQSGQLPTHLPNQEQSLQLSGTHQSHSPRTSDENQQQQQQPPPSSDPNHTGNVRRLPSPVTSPYPQTGTNRDMEEETINAVSSLQQHQSSNNQTHNHQPHQQSSPEQPIEMGDQSRQAQSQQQQQQNGTAVPPGINTTQFDPPTQSELSGYYTGRHQQSNMLPPGFPPLHYLNKPMLSGMGGIEQATDLAQYGMPDILPGHQIHSSTSSNTKVKSDLRLFKCLTCGKDFKQKSTLLQHERIHTDARPYGCSECGKRFRQQSHLTQHLRIHANEKPFTCAYCPRSFRQRAILNQHLRIHSGEKPYSCPECGKHFRQKAILNQHVRTHQDVSPHLIFKNGPVPTLWPQDLPYPPTENDLKEFGDDGSQDGKGVAHSIFGNLGQYLKQNQKGGLPDVIQSGRMAGMPLYVRCPICQKEFKQKSTLLQHGCIHIESRPYPCTECGKRFRQQSHLTQHLRIHTNEKPYGCMYCPRFFRQRTILNQHVRIHTGEKPYKCAQCGKDFRQKAILDQHTRTHQGDRPFCCPMPNCRRRFATEPEVKKHIDNHMNPHASKRSKNNVSNNNNNTLNMAMDKTKMSLSFLGMDAKKYQESMPRMSSVVKQELYFPQCYPTQFSQTLNNVQAQQQQQQQQQQQHPQNTNGGATASEVPPPVVPVSTVVQ